MIIAKSLRITMGDIMNGKKVLKYAHALCDDLDAGRRPSRFDLCRKVAIQLAIPAALGIGALGFAGCLEDEICDNGIDDDGDGQVDCGDEDCFEGDVCVDVPVYGVPFEDVCNDGIDNDGDGVLDCYDPDCASDYCCDDTVNLYGVLVEDCTNGLDDNCNDDFDCEDESCFGHVSCEAAGS